MGDKTEGDFRDGLLLGITVGIITRKLQGLQDGEEKGSRGVTGGNIVGDYDMELFDDCMRFLDSFELAFYSDERHLGFEAGLLHRISMHISLA